MRHHQMIEFFIVTCFILARLIAGCASALPVEANYNETEIPQVEVQLR